MLREMYDSSCESQQGSIGGKQGVERGLGSDGGGGGRGGGGHDKDKERSGARALTNPLSDAKIDLAVSLVTLLSAEGDINAEVHVIYAPDSTGRLAHSVTLINDDIPWLHGAEHAASRVGCRFIHPNISSLVAQKLGEL